MLCLEEEFEELFREQFKFIYNYIYCHVRSAAEAEDLSADVFARAYKYWGSYSPDKGSRRVWLGGIARNLLRSYLKKKAGEPKFIELTEVIHTKENIEEDYLRKEEIEDILDLIENLPEVQRELLNMKYMLHITNRDISKIMNMSENNVGVTIHRAIKTLRNTVEDNHNTK